MITIKQLAEQIGVSKVAVLNKIKANDLHERMEKKGNTYYLDDDLVREIKILFKDSVKNKDDVKTSAEVHKESEVTSDLTAVIETLRTQLEEKDKQIAYLMENNSNLTSTIREMNVAHANEIQMLAIATKDEPIEAGSEVTEIKPGTQEATPEKRKGFFSKLFG